MALTADAMSGEAERLLGQGFDDAQPKPIRPANCCTPWPAWASVPPSPRGARPDRPA
jgi:hypothetical protein